MSLSVPHDIFGAGNFMKSQIIRFLLLATVACPALAEDEDFPARSFDAGAYLVARQAEELHDFQAALDYYLRGLEADPTNVQMLEAAVAASVDLGAFDLADLLADDLFAIGARSPVATLAEQVADAKEGNWSRVEDNIRHGQTGGPLVDALLLGWAAFGQGEIDRALVLFDRAISTNGMQSYGLTHKAFALAAVGDFDGAEALFRAAERAGLPYTRLGAVAHAQILSQLDQADRGLRVLDRVFERDADPAIAALRAALKDGNAVPYSAVRTPAQGMSDIFLTVAGLVHDEADDRYALRYARAASDLWPEYAPATLMVAAMLERLEQYDLANDVYLRIAPSDPAYPMAELGRAEVLRAAGRAEAAIEVLEALSRSFAHLPEVHAARGDSYRLIEDWPRADDAYSTAIARSAPDDSALWFVHFTRGIVRHKADKWPLAEADFRAALALRPDQPQVLNYLGYSLVERGEKLSEALEMIERATAQRPDSGAIVDSLGWVYFQLGRYEEAVPLLEQAVSLEPADPVINDHLGDAFWAVGREKEARFQWHRALSFNPTEADAARIRDKLALGLDTVLAMEGAAPVRFANDNP